MGSVVRMTMSVPAALDPPPRRLGWRATPAAATAGRLSSQRRAVLAVGGALPTRELAAAAAVGDGVVTGMIKAGLLEAVELDEEARRTPDPEAPGVELSPAQARIADELRAMVRAAAPEVALLEGVPGSGKTEVYFEAVAEALRQGAACSCCCRRSRSVRNGSTASRGVSASHRWCGIPG